MNMAFDTFIATAQEIAHRNEINWTPEFDAETGKIVKEQWWDLSAIAGKIERPRRVLSSFGINKSSRVAILKATGNEAPLVMTQPWIEFYKAIAIHDILIRGRGPGNFAGNVGESFRALAACAGDVPPSRITHQIAQDSYNAALLMAASGKRGSTLRATISTWLDATGIADARPLTQACIARVENADVADRVSKVEFASRRQVDHRKPKSLRSDLTQQHYENKIPSEENLYELLRIIFTENPATFSDVVRFNATRVLISTGLRVGEIVSLPAGCLIQECSELPKASAFWPTQPQFLLRYFAEKQGQDARQYEFVEMVQHIPALLTSTISESVTTLLGITRPLRSMVERQRKTGNLFPDFQSDELLPWTDAYTRMSGMIRVAIIDIPENMKEMYRKSYDIEILSEIREQQRLALVKSGASPRVNDYFRRSQSNSKWPLLLRDAQGSTVRLEPNERVSRRSLFVRAGDMEKFVRATMPTKLPDLREGKSSTGKFGLEDRLFLIPGRARAEAAHDAIIDVERYFSVQSLSSADVELHLSGAPDGGRMFARYGSTDKSKQISINPHSLRHLQNTELFRHGVADTIITKRFNRLSTAQSYVYDHRSLAEHLNEMEPATMLATRNLGPNARKAFDLIRGGKIQGPVVESFKRIQKEAGDDIAFEYLNAEAGALHFTPYGFCLNSFAASPCVKHLECFNSCSHLVRSDSPGEQKNLETMKARYELHIGRLKNRPSQAPNFGAQLAHAEERLAGVNAALAQAPGGQVFEDGKNLHLVIGAPRNG